MKELKFTQPVRIRIKCFWFLICLMISAIVIYLIGSILDKVVEQPELILFGVGATIGVWILDQILFKRKY